MRPTASPDPAAPVAREVVDAVGPASVPGRDEGVAGSDVASTGPSIGETLGGGILTVAVLGALFLAPYLVRGFHYPLGYDVPYYTTLSKRASELPVGSLGTIRVVSGLFMAVLMRATGQNALTLVAWVPALITGVAGLAVGSMLWSSLGVTPRWFPVVGLLAWAAFGLNAMVTLHFDNLLNAALVLAAFAAALAFVAGGRGALAVAALFAAAGLTHWPFYAFAMLIYVASVLLFAGPQLWRRLRGREDRFGVGLPLLAAGAASALVVAVPFLLVSPERRVGVRLNADNLRYRFIHRLHEWWRFYAFPLAAGGGYVAAHRRDDPSAPRGRERARGLFVRFMWVWLGVSVLAGVAQYARLPTAGARLFSYLFPITILAGVFVWWLGRWFVARYSGRVGMAAGGLLVCGAMAGFGLLAWTLGSKIQPRLTASMAAQVTAAADYAQEAAPGRGLVVITDGRRNWTLIRSLVPIELLPTFALYAGPPDAYLAAVQAGSSPGSSASQDTRAGGVPTERPLTHPVAVVLQHFDRSGWASVAQTEPERVVAPGVAVVDGPVTGRITAVTAPPIVSTKPVRLVLVSLAVIAILFVAGGGWSVALLPADPVVRISLAPALGVAVIMIGALAWALAGIHLTRWAGLGPLILVGAGGWVAAWFASGRADRLTPAAPASDGG